MRRTNGDLLKFGWGICLDSVSEMALARFTDSEIGKKYPKDTVVFKKPLELSGIQICNGYFSTFLQQDCKRNYCWIL